MNFEMIAWLIVIIWWEVGAASFLFWWTTEHDFIVEGLIPLFFISFMGPIAFPMGWLIHGHAFSGRSRVLIKRKLPRNDAE